MEPSRRESISRQSSILKPSKQRQPLQIVASNPSSSESSPTIKIKRRVSFAKNKRIREFCNEAAEGTVWDDTYEEHDLSSSKSSSTGGTENPVIINLPCDDKENFPIQLFMQPDQLECREVILNVSNQKTDLSQSDDDMDSTLNIYNPPIVQTRIQETKCPDTTVYCDDGMDITVALPSSIIPCHNHAETTSRENPVYSENTVELTNIIQKNNTIHYNDHMEMTAAVAPTITTNYYNNVSSTKKDLFFNPVLPTVNKENLMFHRQKQNPGFVDTKVSSMNFCEKENLPNSSQNITSILKKKMQYPDTTMYFNDGMEITSAIPSNIFLGGLQDKSCNADKFQNPQFISSSVNKDMSLGGQKIVNNTNSALHEQRNNQNVTVYYDDGMEMTAAANPSNFKYGCSQDKNYEEDFPVPQNVSLNIRENLPSIMQEMRKKSSTNISFMNPNDPKLMSELSGTLSSRKNIKNQNSTVYCNDGMEMTAAISSNIMLGTKLNSQNLIKEVNNVSSIPKNKKIHNSNETVYCNDGMEMTSVVPSTVTLGCKRDESYYEDTLLVSQSTLLQSKESVPSIMQEIEKKLSSVDSSFNLKSQKSINEICDSSGMRRSRKIQYQNATLYCNDGMEFTAAIPSNMMLEYNKTHNESTLPVLENNSINIEENKTPIDHQMSKQLRSENSSKKLDLSRQKTVNEKQNVSYMVKNKKRELPDETMYCMEGMEMTGAIPSHIIKRNSCGYGPLVMEKVSHDITENLYLIAKNKNTTVNSQEQSNNVLPKNKKIKYSDKTLLDNDVMEITEAVQTDIECYKNTDFRNNLKPLSIDEDSTKNLTVTSPKKDLKNNKLLELMLSASSSQNNKNTKNPDITVHFNEGMEITAAVSSNLLPQQNPQSHCQLETFSHPQNNFIGLQKDSSSLLQEKQVTSTLMVKEQPKHPNATIFYDDNVETTAAVPSNIISSYKYIPTEITEKVLLPTKDYGENKFSSEILEKNAIINLNHEEFRKESQNITPVETSKKTDCSDKTVHCDNDMETTAVVQNICSNQEKLENVPNNFILSQSQSMFYDNNLEATLYHGTSKDTINEKKQNKVHDDSSKQEKQEIEFENVRFIMSTSEQRTENIFDILNNGDKNNVRSSILLQNKTLDMSECLPFPVSGSNISQIITNDAGKYDVQVDALDDQQVSSEREAVCSQTSGNNHSFSPTSLSSIVRESKTGKTHVEDLNNSHMSQTLSSSRDTLQKKIFHEYCQINQSLNILSEKEMHFCNTDEFLENTEKYLAVDKNFSDSNPKVKHLSDNVTKNHHKILTDVENAPVHHPESNESLDSIQENSVKNFVAAETSIKVFSDLSKTNGNHLSRMPSDDTELLIATMGFKTSLSHPLIINDKTTIKISNDTLINKTISNREISNKTYSDRENVERSQRKSINLSSYQLSSNDIIEMHTSGIFQDNYIKNKSTESDDLKQGKNSSAKIDIQSHNYSEELEEIQPPSFLEDTFQNDSIQNMKSIDNDDDYNNYCEGSLLKKNNLKTEIAQQDKENFDLAEDYTQKNYHAEGINEENYLMTENDQQENCQETLTVCEEVNKKEVNSVLPQLDCKKVETEEPLNPWLLLLKNITKMEQRDDCIWSTHTVNSKMIAINFIQRSLIVVIRFNDNNKDCRENIERVELISRIRSESNNTLIKVVHNILLSKINTNELSQKFKMYEDVLSILEYVSNEVITSMKFMFDLERLSTFYLFDLDQSRASFIVSSKKSNIILKISLPLKLFDEIKPDDIDVRCVLGKIRLNDVKQLMKNIRKDYRYLSRYIHDVKDYITLMEDTARQKR